jgi:Ser/Thr protein kinase RdoA (MazF antagonist)
VALDRNAVLWLDITAGKKEAVRYDVMEALLRGYTSVWPLSRQEARLLALLMPVHQLDLALTNIDYYYGIEQSEERGEWVYNVYLLEHARYYATPQGKKIQEFILQTVDQ